MDDFWIWALGIGTLFSIAVGVSIRRIRKRRAEYELIAPRLGYQINPERVGEWMEIPPEELVAGFQRLPMSEHYRTHSKSFSFVLIRGEGARTFYLFDFWERKPSGRSTTAVRFTALLMNSSACSFPRFAVGPQHRSFFFSGLETEKIGVDGLPTPFRVYGTDRAAIQSLFSAAGTASFWSEKTEWIVEGSGESLVAYKWNQVIPASELVEFESEGRELLHLFERSCSQR